MSLFKPASWFKSFQVKQADGEEVSQQFVNEFRKALLAQLGNKAPIFLADNLETYIKKGIMFNENVYSIIAKICDAAASVPFQLFEVKDQQSLQRYKAASNCANVTGALIQQDKALQLVENSDHRIIEMLKRPNPEQSWSEFIRQHLGFKLTTGNAFIYGVGPEVGLNAGQFHQLWQMPPHYIVIHGNEWFEPVSYYTLLIGDSNQKISADRVLHSRYPSYDFETPGSHLWGLSPLKAGGRALTRSNNVIQTTVTILQNMMPLGFISMQSEESEIDLKQANKIRRRLQKFRGPNGIQNIPILSQAMKWNKIGMDIADLMLIDIAKWDLRSLCNIYKVPSVLFNDNESSTYNNIKEARKSMFTNAVLPELTDLRDELNYWWLDAFNKTDNTKYFLDYDIQAVAELQEDLEKLVDTLDKIDYISYNEKRKVIGYDTHPNPIYDEAFIKTNKIPISQVSQASSTATMTEDDVEQVEDNF